MFNVRKLFDSGFFKKNKKLEIDVKNVEKGKKVLRFVYVTGNEKGKSIEQEIKTENIFID